MIVRTQFTFAYIIRIILSQYKNGYCNIIFIQNLSEMNCTGIYDREIIFNKLKQLGNIDPNVSQENLEI